MVVELLHRPHQPGVALLDQVQELQAPVDVAFGGGYHQPDIGLHHLLFGIVPLELHLSDAVGQLHHLFRGGPGILGQGGHLLLGSVDLLPVAEQFVFGDLQPGLFLFLQLLARFQDPGHLVQLLDTQFAMAQSAVPLLLVGLYLEGQAQQAVDHGIKQFVAQLQRLKVGQDLLPALAYLWSGLLLILEGGEILNILVIPVDPLQQLQDLLPFAAGGILRHPAVDIGLHQFLHGQFMLFELLGKAHELLHVDRGRKRQAQDLPLAFLYLLGYLDLLLPVQQGDPPDLMQVHPHRIVEAQPDGHFRRLLLFALGLLPRLLDLVPLLFGIDHLHAGLGQHHDEILQLLRRDDILGQHFVQLLVGDKPLGLAETDYLLDLLLDVAVLHGLS